MEKIIKFFDDRAKDWDSHSIPVEEKMKYILDKASLVDNKRILDVACGTGAMTQFLLRRNPKRILAVDISEKMIEKAKDKFDDLRVEFKNMDVLNVESEEFDYIVVYNAFPHFLEPEKLIKKAYNLLVEGGRFVICHGMGRKDLNTHHERKASEISLGLAPAIENAKMIEDLGFKVEYIEDVKEIYIISAIK